MATTEIDARRERAAKNQSLFREVNEQIEQLPWTASFTDFVCECLYEDCFVRIPLTLEQYESLRRVPTRFAVAPGHNVDEVERVVEANGRFVVVEKFGAGGPVAIKLDPRASRRSPEATPA